MIKIQSEVILRACKIKAAGALRLWFLAKSFDTQGAAKVNLSAFRAYLIDDLGMKRSAVYLWLKKALDLRIITQGTDGNTYLVSWERCYRILGIDRITAKSMELIDAKTLVSKGWINSVWACYIRHFENKPVGQRTLKELTGISERSQRRYEKKARIKKHANYIVMTGRKASELTGIKEFQHPGAFVHNGSVCYRSVNTRKEIDVQLSKRGRLRKVKKELRVVNNEKRHNLNFRYFNRNAKELKATLNKIRRASIRGLDVPCMVLTAAAVGVWQTVIV